MSVSRLTISLPLIVTFALVHVACICGMSNASANVAGVSHAAPLRPCCAARWALSTRLGNRSRGDDGRHPVPLPGDCPNCLASSHALNDLSFGPANIVDPHLHLLAFAPLHTPLLAAGSEAAFGPLAQLTRQATQCCDVLRQTCALLI